MLRFTQGKWVDEDELETGATVDDIDSLRDADMALFFLIDADAQSADGYMFDNFNDETEVDTAGSTNQLYDASGDYYGPDVPGTNNMTLISEPRTAASSPTISRASFFVEEVDASTVNTDFKGYVSEDDGSTWDEVTLAEVAVISGSSASWNTDMSETLDGNGGSWANYTIRQLIPASELSSTGTQVRVTFESSSSEGLKVDNASIVEQDSGANGTEAPTELLFSTSSGFDISSSTTITSDALVFDIDPTKSYLVIFDVSTDSATDGFRTLTASPYIRYSKAATNSYADQNLAGASTGTNDLAAVKTVEVYSASSQIKQYSADETLTAGSGTDMLQKFATFNTKEINLHAWGQRWRNE